MMRSQPQSSPKSLLVPFLLTTLLLGCSGESGSSAGAASGGGSAGGDSANGGAVSGGQSAIGGGTASIGGSAPIGGAGAGGAQSTGGTTAIGSVSTGGSAAGGAVPTGGKNGTGGSSMAATGGSVSTGGTAAVGGAVATGGKVSAGGTNTAPATGGNVSTGGVAATGGKVSTGGVAATGGKVSTGGVAATGGKVSTGGVAATGGKVSTGGVAATGGSAAGGASSCLTPPAASPLVGWASVNALNTNGTTGGGNATPLVVTTFDAFKAAVSGTNAAVVYLNAKLPAGAVAVGSNKTIVGVCGAEFHGHLGVSGSANVIIRNLKIVGYAVGDCTLDPAFDATVGCSSGADAVSITNAAHHVWFDHCDISDGTDGNLDINAASDYITISWTKFHYTPRTDNVGNDSTGVNGHRFSNLIGSGDNVTSDVGHLNVTWVHDWWADNVNQRMPRTRFGQIHVVNCLYTSVGDSYCTNAGIQTHVLVENTVYIGVKNPLSPDANGDMLARNNVYTNTTGTTTATGTGFTPPYTLTPEPTSALQAAITSGAGPH